MPSVVHCFAKAPALQLRPETKECRGYSHLPVRLAVARDTRGDHTAAASSSQQRISRRSSLSLLTSGAVLLSSHGANAAPVSQPFCGVTDYIPSWAFSVPWEERYVEHQGLQLWTRVVGTVPSDGFFGIGKKGDASKLPLVCVHGGPGFGSSYLQTLELLAGEDRRVAFYDQGGCGKSLAASTGSGPTDASLAYYMDELSAVVQGLGFESYHLFGEGWGGMLAVTGVAAGKLPGAKSLTLVGVPDSYAALVKDRVEKVQQLPDDAARSVLQEDGVAGSAVGPAIEEYRQRFVCHRSRVGCVQDVWGQQTSSTAATQLCGGANFKVVGPLADWRLDDTVALPALLCVGEDGELSMSTAESLHRKLPNSTLVPFTKAATFVHIDQHLLFLQRVTSFLNDADKQTSSL